MFHGNFFYIISFSKIVVEFKIQFLPCTSKKPFFTYLGFVHVGTCLNRQADKIYKYHGNIFKEPNLMVGPSLFIISIGYYSKEKRTAQIQSSKGNLQINCWLGYCVKITPNSCEMRLTEKFT